MRRSIFIGVVIVGALAAAGFLFRPDRLLATATGTVSQSLCSKVFVSGFSAESVLNEQLRPEPGFWLIDWAVQHTVDRDARDVRASLLGVFKSRSVFADGRGCTIVADGLPDPAPLRIAPQVPALLAEIAGPDVVTPQDPALVAALDAAFAEVPDERPRNTKAVVILHQGRVVAERYAPGVGVRTPLLSHSIAKSIVNALSGTLAAQGKLDVMASAKIAEWQGPGDSRGQITPDQLLRMTSGLDFDEGAPGAKAPYVWFTQSDMAAWAATVKPVAKPGARWAYSSLGYMLLSRIVSEAIGGGPQAAHDFAQTHLFGPLGMRDTLLQFDAAGTMMGGSAFFGSARDWARFGQLYLQDGVVGGRRLLPEGWVKYTTMPSGAASYGAGFWLNVTDDKIPEWNMPWSIPGAPRDAYFARGYLGQFIVVVPSAELVIVRCAQSHRPGGDGAAMGALVKAAVDAVHRQP
jgi:CubicO group peptidase (beta-lactamase class C family)